MTVDFYYPPLLGFGIDGPTWSTLFFGFMVNLLLRQTFSDKKRRESALLFLFLQLYKGLLPTLAGKRNNLCNFEKGAALLTTRP
jgi:hypothetical protein